MTQDKSSSPIPEKPRRRWVRVLLFVSLALNLVVLGIAGGAVLNHARGDNHPTRISRELGLGPYMFALDDEGRRAIRKAADANRDTLRASRNAWRATFAETLEVLRAETFDADRFNTLVARQAELASAGRSTGQDILAAEVATMTPDERAAFADRLEKGLRFDKRRGGQDRSGPKKQ